jgi:hypothetical protein
MEDERSEKRIDDLAGRADRFEADVKTRFDKVDREFAKADHRRERFEDKVDERFDKVDERFKGVASKEDLAKLGARLDNWGKIITGGVVTIVSAVILKMFGV